MVSDWKSKTLIGPGDKLRNALAFDEAANNSEENQIQHKGRIGT